MKCPQTIYKKQCFVHKYKIPMSKIKTGDKIPPFSTSLEDGSAISDKSLFGQKFILFFYGQDDTPTCTKQACSIRDDHDTFVNEGYKVFGISKDSAKKHQKFIAKYNLPYSILVDEDTTIMRSFGLFGPKIFMGKEVEGIYRSAIVVNESGVVTHIVDEVKAAENGQQIKELLGLN
jgi:thioredoxin-dependent peroxiredoxin